MGSLCLEIDRAHAADHVLLVVEDRFLRKLLRHQLEALGLSVQEALSGVRALARAEAQVPDLVLLDLWVDHGAGLDFLASLRGRETGRHVPVLLVGTETRPRVREAAAALGAAGPMPAGCLEDMATWIERALLQQTRGH
jgi:CheY-like chemotaxis protein